MHYQLNDVLVREARAGRQFVLVIDESQNLSESVLESIRLLSDFETSQGKLLQIILAGQRQLIDTLMKPSMLQLTQRISVTNFLDPLDAKEVTQYISHRLGVAGYQGKPLFTTEALQLIVEETRGIPRTINNICFGALSTAFALGKKGIDRKIVEEVAGEQSVRLLAKRMQVSSIARMQPEKLSGLDLETEPDPKFTWRKIFRSSSLRKHARGTACLLVVLLVMTSRGATSKRPELAVQVSAGNKAESTPQTALFAVALAARFSVAINVFQACQNALPTPFLGDRLMIVEPGQTLRQICPRHLGRHTLRIVRPIQALSPKLEPNRIEVGQRIWLSLQGLDSTKVRDEGKQAPVIRPEGKGI